LWNGIGYRLVLPPQRHDKLAAFRALVIDAHPLCPTAASVRSAVDNLAGRLAKQGCTVLRTHPEMPDLARTTRNYVELLVAFFAADLPPEALVWAEGAASALGPDDLSLTAAQVRGLTMSHVAWIKASRARGALRAHWQALFRDIDVLLCPPMPTPAFRQDQSARDTRTIEIDGKAVPYDDQIAWAAVATSVGLPATVAPIGQSERGLPVGVQIIGGYLDDRTTIAFAGMIEREFGGFVPPPSFAG